MDIQKIGKTELEQYRDIASQERPWRFPILNRAEIVSHRAQKLVECHASEDSWRFSIENEVFHRFDYEVAW